MYIHNIIYLLYKYIKLSTFKSPGCALASLPLWETAVSWANTWITWPEGNRQHTLADVNHSGDKRAHYAVWQLRLGIPRLLFVGSCCPLIFCPAATVMPGLNPLKAKRRQRRRLPTSTPCSVHCNAHETDFSLFNFPFRTFSNVFYCYMVSFWWLFTAAPFPKCIDWHIDWSQNDEFSNFFFRTIIQDLLGPIALMAAMDRASVMRLIRCLLQWNVPEEACLTWWPTW